MRQEEPESLTGHPEWDPSFQLRDLPGLMWRRRGWMVASLLGSLMLGVVYIKTATPVYTVRARLLVQLRDLPLQEDNHQPRARNFLATQAEIIRSPAVLRPAMESISLAPIEGTEEEQLEEVLDSFVVTPVDKTNVLTLSFWGPNPVDGARLVDATIESYRTFVREANQAESHALRVLTRKEQELRDELNDLEARYAKFRARSGLVGTNQKYQGGSRVMLNRLEEQIVEARARRFELEGETNALERELKAARTAEDALNAQYSLEMERVRALDAQQLEGQQILDEMERVREVHQWMLGKLKQWELTQEALTQLEGGVMVRTLEGPGLPSKVWPNPVLVLGPCLLVGLVGGVLAAIIVDYARLRTI